MSLIRISKRIKNNKISKLEFCLTSKILDCFLIEIDEDYNMIRDYAPIYCADKELAYSEHYSSINTEIPKSKILFRPIKNERHSNILIEMFEELNGNVERLEIKEFLNKNGKKRYSGYFIGKDNYGDDIIIKKSIVKSLPSVTALKTAIIAKCMMNNKEYNDYLKDLKDLIFNERVS